MTKKLVTAAMLAAVYVVLDYFSIQVGPALRISITILPVALAGAILGWQYGAMVGAVGDVLMYFLKNNSGAYMPGLTIGAAAAGAVFGLIVHNYITGVPHAKEVPAFAGMTGQGGRDGKQIRSGELLVRVIAAQVIVTVVISLLWNTWNLALLLGNTFWPFFWLRLEAELVQMGVLIVLEYLVLVTYFKMIYRKT